MKVSTFKKSESILQKKEKRGDVTFQKGLAQQTFFFIQDKHDDKEKLPSDIY